jgi:hypothetical protein
MASIGDFADAFSDVQGYVQEVLRLDASDLDPEAAASYQDKAAETALRWIAEHSVDVCSRHLAVEVLKAIDSDGKRW